MKHNSRIFAEYELQQSDPYSINRIMRPLCSPSPLISSAPLNTALIRIVTVLLLEAKPTCIWIQYDKNKTTTTLLIFRFFHYMWFIDSKNLCFIFILKEKMTRFFHLLLFISLTLKQAPPSNQHRRLISTAIHSFKM